MIKIVANKKRSGAGGWLLFWLAFFIGMTVLFMLNLERIKDTLRETRVLERFAAGTEEPPEETDEPRPEPEEGSGEPAPRAPMAEEGGRLESERLESERPENGRPENGRPGNGRPGNGRPGTGEESAPPRVMTPGPIVERPVYLMKVDTTGAILWISVKRKMSASDRPLQDALEALIKGPSAEEEKQGLISLIPKNVKILSAAVRGNTAYISFSEDFLFNTYGVEGYVGQRRQVVMTATEFGNVRDVQILIDGKRVDYLGESIWIGSPVSRNML
ncbi:MAG: GerMN domain-containing protein [Treponema sp.]|jgi:spore germination protein GerM|nr:GerMN domain-containing protein [Treponema sp.]